MTQTPFRNLKIGDEFKRRNFASGSRQVPGLLGFRKIADSDLIPNCVITSDDYKDKQLTLDLDEEVFAYDPRIV